MCGQLESWNSENSELETGISETVVLETVIEAMGMDEIFPIEKRGNERRVKIGNTLWDFQHLRTR